MKVVQFLGVLYVPGNENDKYWQTQHRRIKDYVNEQFWGYRQATAFCVQCSTSSFIQP